MIRLLIISDIRLYREGLTEFLDHRAEVTVVGTATDWPDAAPRMTELRPDVVLLDMAAPGVHEAAREIGRIAPEARVVALGIREVAEDVVACAESGFAGYVRREGSLDDLLRAVEGATRGELHCSPRMAADLLRRLGHLAASHGTPRMLDRLTARERQCAQLIERGLSNKEIARELGIELLTVKNHVHNLLEKLQVRRRIEAARLTRIHYSPLRSAANPRPA